MIRAARYKHRGLSAVEVLVILAIVGILIGLLLPAITWMRERAKITVCGSNLRQIGIAIQSYRSSNHDQLPIARSMPEPFSLPIQAADPHYANPLFKCLAGYLPQNSGVYRCPGDATQVYARCSALSPEQLGISYFYFVFPRQSPAGKKQILVWDYSGDSLHGLIHPPFHRGANTLHLDGSVSYGSD